MPIASISDYSKETGGGDGASGKELPPYGPGGIYHEKQVAAMCAVHCVNNMLQGPVFQYADFGRVAQQLEREEARLLGGTGMNDGGQMRADGFFNVQVIQHVLTSRGFLIENCAGSEGLHANMDAAKETAFILNKNEHWFALRRIGAEWFDLNSCIKVPQHFNSADVRWHVGDAVKQGYTVFVVRGPFPPCDLENDAKKLVEAVQGCGRPGQGYSLFAGGGQSIGGTTGNSAQMTPAEMRAARLARLGGGGPPAVAQSAPVPAPVPSPVSQASAPAAAPMQAAPPSAAGNQLQGLAAERAARYREQQAQKPPADPKMTQLMEMGFSQEQCADALRASNGDLDGALNRLLGGA